MTVIIGDGNVGGTFETVIIGDGNVGSTFETVIIGDGNVGGAFETGAFEGTGGGKMCPLLAE